MNINLIAALLILASSCGNQTNNAAKSSLDTTKGLQQNDNDEASIKSIMAHTVTLLRNHNVDVNNDRCFAEMMMYYNHAAIDMSDVLFKESKNSELKKFVKEKMSKRKDEMNEMSLFLQREPEDKSSTSKDFQNSVNNAISKMNISMNFRENDVDNLYIQSMITLQQCGIDMAEAELKYGSHQTLKIHARNIVSANEEEIEWMQTWFKKNQLK